MHISIDERRNTGGEILRRLFEPEKGNLSPEVAAFLLSIDFAAADRDRMGILAEKSQAGELQSHEREELDDYVRIGQLVALIQSKARQSLNQNRAAS